jgi:NADH:ubiquinone oxidoreductase subunit E
VINEERSGMSATEIEKVTRAVTPGDEVRLTAKLEKVLAAHTGTKSELIPILQEVQQVYGLLC